MTTESKRHPAPGCSETRKLQRPCTATVCSLRRACGREWMQMREWTCLWIYTVSTEPPAFFTAKTLFNMVTMKMTTMMMMVRQCPSVNPLLRPVRRSQALVRSDCTLSDTAPLATGTLATYGWKLV